MRLSVSQIAWVSGKDPEFLDLLADAGFHDVDIAPTKIWPEWAVGDPSPEAFRQYLGSRGMNCAGMQSLFFGLSEANVFGDDASWKKLKGHFGLVCGLAQSLGVTALVFGAPANRDPGEGAAGIPPNARERFGVLGDMALSSDTCLCLEPVPADLGSRFLCTTDETAAFVRTLGHKAVKMNLDTAVLVAEGWDAAETRGVVRRNLDVIGHVHASEPQLGSFSKPQAFHAEVAETLRDGGYAGAVAIEMRADADPVRTRANLIEALRFVGGAYRLN